MKQTILGKSCEAAQQEVKRKIVLCVIIALACLAINAVLLAVYTTQLHTLFLVLNVLTDVAGSWIIFAYVSLAIVPQKRLCDLLLQPTERLQGTVREISEETQKICNLDCRLVKLNDRTVFLPAEGKISVKEGETLVFYLASNVVVGVDYE